MLEEEIQKTFGVSLDEIINKYRYVIDQGVADQHQAEIDALSMAIVSSFSKVKPANCWSASRLLFALGYHVGKNQPDLSVFEDAIK